MEVSLIVKMFFSHIVTMFVFCITLYRCCFGFFSYWNNLVYNTKTYKKEKEPFLNVFIEKYFISSNL